MVVNDEVTKTSPEKSLTKGTRKTGGGSRYGRKTARHKGGGSQARLPSDRLQSATRTACPRRSPRSSNDPIRTSNIALLHYHDGEKRYPFAPQGLKVGMTVQSGDGAEIEVGNSLPLSNIRPVP